ncbi:MAG: response regulator transcription factor [Prolixibacteraceae bacterium]|nr:response regulator transcription factor [Prolixibacteraceae bacterium]
MKLRTIAIDDEPLALALLTDYIKKTPFLELTASFDNPLDALDYFNNEGADLLLVDIQMPDLKGTELVKIINEGPKIIFTTAYPQYAIEGFKLNATDYLLKPFGYDEFLKAVQKAYRLFELESNSSTAVESNNDFLFLKSEYKIRKISFNNILYIEGLKDYIKVYCSNEPKPIMSLNSLRAIEQKLPEDTFMRIHRSFIVNLSKIEVIDRSRIVFGKEYIPVSEQYKEKFQAFLDKNFL